uniref:Uncharacterized protein n=1 Tax=Arundo donax TaxID=35708 RepID=A0A0A8Z3X6_ARUDO
MLLTYMRQTKRCFVFVPCFIKWSVSSKTVKTNGLFPCMNTIVALFVP